MHRKFLPGACGTAALQRGPRRGRQLIIARARHARRAEPRRTDHDDMDRLGGLPWGVCFDAALPQFAAGAAARLLKVKRSTGQRFLPLTAYAV